MKKILLSIGAIAMVAVAQAQIVVYSNTSSAVQAGTSAAMTDDRTFGDFMTTTGTGILGNFAFSSFNSTTGGNTGAFLTCSYLINFYDNTTPYTTGAITNPLLGSATVNVDFTNGGANPGGLAAGFFSTITVNLAANNINLSTTNLFITQNMTMITGTSTRDGVVIVGPATVGTGSNTSVYMKGVAVAEGQYSFGGTNNDFMYRVETVPEPATFLALGAGLALIAARRRRK